MNLGENKKIQNLESQAKTEKVLDVLIARLDNLISEFSYSVNGLEDSLCRFEAPKDHPMDTMDKTEISPVNEGALPELFRLIERLDSFAYRNTNVLKKLNTII